MTKQSLFLAAALSLSAACAWAQGFTGVALPSSGVIPPAAAGASGQGLSNTWPYTPRYGYDAMRQSQLLGISQSVLPTVASYDSPTTLDTLPDATYLNVPVVGFAANSASPTGYAQIYAQVPLNTFATSASVQALQAQLNSLSGGTVSQSMQSQFASINQ